LNLSPPLNLDPRWLGAHVAYTISKYGMSLCALGMAEEFRSAGIAFNGLWPISTIDTSAVRFVLGGDQLARASRTSQIMADAAYAIFNKPSREFTGNLVLDEPFLRSEGEVRFERYAIDPGTPLQPDLFVCRTELAGVPTRFASSSP
jgi:citronellol/citronellal dehydrogenase